METNRSAKLDSLWRALRSRRGAPILGAVLLIGLIVWLLPRRVERIVPADGTAGWNAEDAAPRRQVVWKSPEEIRNILPDDSPATRLATPRLSDAGATLYLTRRDKNGRADIYRTRLVDGQWQPAQPVVELNTAGDEIGPTLSRDGRELFFYSNRPGGHGGFDLYVSTHAKNGWSVPRNLGARVNSSADEYSPAMAPDGKTLYFASNRSKETATAKESDDAPAAWNATIRTRRGLQTFDLFAAGRDGDDWQTPEPLSRLNRKDSSEGAPYPSPDGAFLYFASDRKSRQGEKRNLDLYRARIVDGKLGRPENLGPRINTEAHETEPALSPEGFTLLFSSDRFDGRDRLFASTAQEVYLEQEWDSSHLPVIPSFWWWTLAVSLAAAVLLAYLTYCYRERMLEKVWPARFFLGSVLVNLLLLLLLAVWKLDVIELIAQRFGDEDGPPAPGVRGVIDQSDTSAGDTRKAFERVNDLAPVKQPVENAQANAPVDDPAAMHRVELSIPKTDAQRDPLRPSKNVILLNPQNRRPEPARKQPTKQQVVNRMALARSKPVELTPPEDLRLDPNQPPAARKIERNIKLGRQPRMSRPASIAIQPKSRMERITAKATVVELQKADPSRAPPAAAKTSAPRTIRSVAQFDAAQPVIPDSESATNIAASRSPEEKPIESEKNALGKTAAANPSAPAPQIRAPDFRRAIKTSPVPESPLEIAKSNPVAAKLKSPDELFKSPREKKQTIAGIAAIAAAKTLKTHTPPAVSLGPIKTAKKNVVLEKSPLPGSSPLRPSVKAAHTFNPRAKTVSFLQQSGFEARRPDPAGRSVPPSPKRSLTKGAGALVLANADRKLEVQTSTSPPPPSLTASKTPLKKSAAGDVGSLVPLKHEIGNLRTIPRAFTAKKKSRSRKRPRNTNPVGVKLASLERAAARGGRIAAVRERIDLSTMLILRGSKMRKKHIEKLGGSKESEKAVNRGLKWLADHQNPDGSWSLNRFHQNCKGKHPTCSGLGKEHSDTAATGMALLPFLAAGNTHRKGEYRKTVAAAVKWIVDHQKPNGDLLVKGDAQHMYSHGIASIALCEAFGMSQDANLKTNAQRAVDFIVKAQTKSLGGWRYTPGKSSDTSVVGWQMMALKSGEMAGLTVPKSTFDNVRRWLKSVEGKRAGGGTFGYASRGSSPAMTAEGLLCLQFMEAPEDDRRLHAGADYLMQHLPSRSSNLTSYYWYYATQVMYHMQGKYWQAWNTRMRETLAKSQIKTGHLAGTWTPRDRWEQRGGRVYTTAMRVLILEVYYRHLPIYQSGER